MYEFSLVMCVTKGPTEGGGADGFPFQYPIYLTNSFNFLRLHNNVHAQVNTPLNTYLNIIKINTTNIIIIRHTPYV